MKNAWRIGLLVLVAVLLPLRGAMAAAMLCSPALAGAQTQAHAGAAGDSKHDAHTTHEHVVHEHAQHDHDHSEHAGKVAHTALDDSACSLCAAFCSATPLPSGTPTLSAPSDYTSAAFPELRAATPSFVSGGPERPPRSI